MAEFPVYVRRSSYRGQDRKKQLLAAKWDADACLLEAHINKEIKEKGRTRFLYSQLAAEMNMDVDWVRKILCSVDAGGNGFTVFLPEGH